MIEANAYQKFEAANTGTMFTYDAMNRRSETSTDGVLRMKQDCTEDDMLSRWAAVRARDPDKMSMTDVMVALATNVSMLVRVRGPIYCLTDCYIQDLCWGRHNSHISSSSFLLSHEGSEEDAEGR